MTLTKADIAQKIANDCGFMKGEAAEVFDKMIELMKNCLIAGEDVMISGFGKWTVKSKHARRGRNPKTGEQMILDARRVVTWSYSPVLKAAVNRDGKGAEGTKQKHPVVLMHRFSLRRSANMIPISLRQWFIPCLAVLFLVSLITGCQESDEQVLRREFGLPSTVKLLAIKSSPEKPGFFGREGLDITASFQLDPAEFEKYLKDALRDGTWKPMPPDREFLIRMTGIRAAMKGVEKWAEVTGKPIPPLGSVYNPTENQLFERWVPRLPLDVKNGLYQCKTAGDNLLHSWKKVPCSEKSGDLNDFIFAVLDTEQKVLRIKLHTRY